MAHALLVFIWRPNNHTRSLISKVDGNPCRSTLSFCVIIGKPKSISLGISNHLSGPKLLNKSKVLHQIDDELTIKSNQNKSSLVGQSWIYKSISCSISYKQLSKVFSVQIEVNTISNHPIYVLALLENEVNSCFMNNDKFCSTSSYNSKKTSFPNFCSSHWWSAHYFRKYHRSVWAKWLLY